jgi:uncharacterized secreted repeat protein (TIGR03808 family)
MTCSTNPTRRRFLALSAGAAVAALPSLAPVSVLAGQAIPAPDFGVTPGSGIDQTAALQHAIDEARRADMPLFLPPGRYEISRLSLATGARLIGVAGATRLVSHTSGSLMAAAGAGHVSVRGIVFDGAGIGGGPDALVRLADVRRAEITDCEIIGSAGSGIDLANCGGRIAGNRFSGMARVAIHSLDGSELDILDNEIAGCGDNGIRVCVPGSTRSWRPPRRPC